jgi:hypothetical protein
MNVLGCKGEVREIRNDAREKCKNEVMMQGETRDENEKQKSRQMKPGDTNQHKP